MTKAQFTEAYKLAQDTSVTLTNEDIAHFDGFGLSSFRAAYCTIRQVARLLRYQAQQFNGNWDANAVDEVAYAARRKFIIIG